MSKNLPPGTLLPDGSKIAQLRKEKGWSQEKLAEKCRVSKKTVQRIEKSEPAFANTLQCLAEAIGISVRAILLADRSAPGGSDLPKIIHIATLRSGDLSYTREIWFGLRAKLAELSREAGFRFEYEDVTGPIDPFTEPQARDEWGQKCRAIERANGGKEYDYYVSIGTQASLALSAHFGPSFGKIPVLFLGVTDPVASGLVMGLGHRCEAVQITGVAYGPGIGGIASQVHNLFPNRKLIFVYRSGFPQDESAAHILGTSPLVQKGVLQIVRTKEWPTLDDLADSDAVYFSWYTFEAMFEDPALMDILRQRFVIATTRGNVKKTGMAVAGVAADDEQIGRMGAEMIVRHLQDDSINWGSVSIAIPEIHYWINLSTANERSIEFSERALEEAQVVFS